MVSKLANVDSLPRGILHLDHFLLDILTITQT